MAVTLWQIWVQDMDGKDAAYKETWIGGRMMDNKKERKGYKVVGFLRKRNNR
jgi:hypothetical protein